MEPKMVVMSFVEYLGLDALLVAVALFDGPVDIVKRADSKERVFAVVVGKRPLDETEIAAACAIYLESNQSVLIIPDKGAFNPVVSVEYDEQPHEIIAKLINAIKLFGGRITPHVQLVTNTGGTDYGVVFSAVPLDEDQATDAYRLWLQRDLF